MKAVPVFLAVLLFAALQAPAQAAEWTLLAQSDNNDTTLYYAEKSVQRLGDFVRLRTKRVYSKERGQELADDLGFQLAVAYTVETQTVDCAKMRRAVQKITYFGYQGKILDRTINQAYVWRPYSETSLNNAVCDLLNAGKKN